MVSLLAEWSFGFRLLSFAFEFAFGGWGPGFEFCVLAVCQRRALRGEAPCIISEDNNVTDNTILIYLLLTYTF